MTRDEKLKKYGQILEKHLRGLTTYEQMTAEFDVVEKDYLEKLKAAKVPQVVSETPEWTEMWAKLFAMKGNYICPITGEYWQYMGTYRLDGLLFHQFRHRSYHGKNTTVNINPSEKFLNEHEPKLITV